MLGLESLNSLALSAAVAQNQHTDIVVDCGPGPAEHVVRLSALHWQLCAPCAFASRKPQSMMSFPPPLLQTLQPFLKQFFCS